MGQLPHADGKRHDFTKTVSQNIFPSIENEPFQPYCYSNVDNFVDIWYDCFERNGFERTMTYKKPCSASALDVLLYIKLDEVTENDEKKLPEFDFNSQKEGTRQPNIQRN